MLRWLVIGKVSLALAVLVATPSVAHAYSTPSKYPLTYACKRLATGSIDAFVEYLEGHGTKQGAIASLDKWIGILETTHPHNVYVKRFAAKELSGIKSVKRRFLAGRIKTVDNALPYIVNGYYLRQVCEGA